MKLIYSTFEKHQEALQMAKQLLENKVIACANINHAHTSVYEWQGKVCEGREVAVWFKTPDALCEQAQQRIKDLHPYECPCIFVVDVESVTKKFDKWMQDQVGIDSDNRV